MHVAAYILVLILSACSVSTESKSESEEKGKRKELTFLSNFPSETLDLHLNYTPVRAGIAETLVKINENSELEPWLAKEWKSDDSGQTWTFTIRENITFQNGSKVDAEAVKRSLERNIEVSEAMKNALKIKTMSADGQVLTITTEKELQNICGKDISYIFQDYQGAFTPFITIGKQFDEMLKTHTSMSRKERKEYSLLSLKNVQLPEERVYKSYPFQLSGGQLQRAFFNHSR